MKKSQLVTVAVLVWMCGCTGSQPTAPATDAVAPAPKLPHAMEIADRLKEGGFSFAAWRKVRKKAGLPLEDVTDTTDSGLFRKEEERAGVASTAQTATDAADVSIHVYRSKVFRNEASQRLTKLPAAIRNGSYAAVCGPIMVDFTPDNANLKQTAAQERDKALGILRQHYNCD